MIVQIENDGDDLILPLGEDLCKELGWSVGDTLLWTDNHDGTFTLSKSQCSCRKCMKSREKSSKSKSNDLSSTFPSEMIVCSKCGNKRCPHATDHNLECSSSNEPGQPGSVYS